MSAPLGYRIREFFARLGERIADFGRALVSPFERLFGWFGERLVHSGGGFERAEGLLGRVLRAAAAPFRLLARLLLPDWLRNLWHATSEAALRVLTRLSDALNLDGLFRWIAWLTQPLWRPVAAILGFCYAWVATRPYRQMVWGLPALLLLAPVVAAAGWRLVRGPGDLAQQYQNAAKQAMEAEDFKTMQLWERKLAQLGVDTNFASFRTASKLAESPDKEKQAEGRRRMELLATPDAPGYPQAHFWLLQHLLSGEGADTLEERLRLADGHLKQLAARGIRGDAVDLMRAMWLLQSGKKAEAADMLAPLAPRDPLASSQLMMVSAELGRTETARKEAARVSSTMLEARENGALPTLQSVQVLAAAQQLLGDAKGLEAALREWIKLDPAAAQARQALGQLSLSELREALKERAPDGRRLGRLLLDAASYVPEDAPITMAIGIISQHEQARELLRDIAAETYEDHDAPAALMMTLGTFLAQAGDEEPAAQLLKRVVEAEPENGPAWNNYAWALLELGGKGNDEQKELARQAADRAVALDPNSASFRETRGQVLVALGEWQAAADDLEYALNGLPESKTTHAALARAYRELGNADLAAAHEALAR